MLKISHFALISTTQIFIARIQHDMPSFIKSIKIGKPGMKPANNFYRKYKVLHHS